MGLLVVLAVFLGDGSSDAEGTKGVRACPVEYSIPRGLVVATLYTCRLPLGRDQGFLCQAHHRLQEVVVQPHLVVELVDGEGLGDGVEPIVAQASS